MDILSKVIIYFGINRSVYGGHVRPVYTVMHTVTVTTRTGAKGDFWRKTIWSPANDAG